MQPLYYLTYTSRLTVLAAYHRETFLHIFDVSSKNNKKLDITGFLCFKNGYFFQFLEGEETAVKQLYTDTCRDKRHKEVTLLTEGTLQRCQFDDWSMYCLNLDTDATGENISPYFDEFDTLHWDAAAGQQVITDVMKYCQSSHYEPQSEYQVSAKSYLSSRTHSLVKQHHAFVMLQIGLMVLFLLGEVGLLLYRYFFTY